MIQTQPSLVLASSSPRRNALLKSFSIHIQTHHSDIDEDSFIWDPECVENGAKQLALLKAKKALETHPQSIIIGVDTVVAIDSHVLGKPKDKHMAKQYLQKLSGMTHRVISGCAIISEKRAVLCSDTTYVTCNTLTNLQLEAYLNTDIWTDKAGGYAIQGAHGALLVQSIHGCYFNVTGFPLGKLVPILDTFGISLWNALPSVHEGK